jgi:hypothetical protein
MIRSKFSTRLLLASVTLVGLGGCTKVVQTPAPADHHDDGHDRDRRAPPPPPQDHHDKDHPPPPQRQ